MLLFNIPWSSFLRWILDPTVLNQSSIFFQPQEAQSLHTVSNFMLQNS